jgi:RHS repeat-associated protein
VVRYQYDNHLGSACLELDANANIISYEEYHPFGTTSYRAGRSYAETSLKRYKYCGKERDEETGLYYYGARYYAGWLCRWISTDPKKEEYLNLSPYNYCANNPIKYVDPDGMRIDEWEVNIDTGELKHISGKGGNDTQYITHVNSEGKIFRETQVWNVSKSDIYIGPAAENYKGDWVYRASYLDLWSSVPDEYLGHYTFWDLKERYNKEQEGYKPMSYTIEDIKLQEAMHLDRRDMIWGKHDLAKYMYKKYGSTNSLWLAVETRMFVEFIPFWTPGPVKPPNKLSQTSYANYIKSGGTTPTFNNISNNSWIAFLQKNKGAYKNLGIGKDWIQMARKDYLKLK